MPGIDLPCGQAAVKVSLVSATKAWEATGQWRVWGRDVTGSDTGPCSSQAAGREVYTGTATPDTEQAEEGFY